MRLLDARTLRGVPCVAVVRVTHELRKTDRKCTKCERLSALRISCFSGATDTSTAADGPPGRSAAHIVSRSVGLLSISVNLVVFGVLFFRAVV